MKNLTVIFIFLFLCQNTFSQSDDSFQKILTTVFDHDSISRETFTNTYLGLNTVYIQVNNLMASYTPHYLDSIYGRMSTNIATTAPIVKTDKGLINLFLYPDILDARSEHKINKVVVMDRLSISKKIAKISFHTTNLNSKYFNWDWKSKSVKYHKYNCTLGLEGSEWKIKNLKIKEYPLKSLH